MCNIAMANLREYVLAVGVGTLSDKVDGEWNTGIGWPLSRRIRFAVSYGLRLQCFMGEPTGILVVKNSARGKGKALLSNPSPPSVAGKTVPWL